MSAPLSLNFQERVSFSLRDLYRKHGYTQYKMSKFEEYDLYARNKDFLVDHSVITFMDTNGRLMALKPDVTLSIVKNTRDDAGTVQKLYYNENVYRVSKSNGSFRELMQVGLECLGQIDDYCVCEVLSLAAESLRAISPDCILDISHLGLLSALVDAIGIPADCKSQAFTAIGQKNLHELAALCGTFGLSESSTNLLKQAVTLSGPLNRVLPRLKELLSGIVDTKPLDQLLKISAVSADAHMFRFDFSAVDNLHYYNGIVFKGYLRGLPDSILSGGQYSKLMEKMGRKSGAIGFAVYLDTLERLEPRSQGFDVDTVLLYEETTPMEAIEAQAGLLRQDGRSVLVQRHLPENLRCRQIIRL